ncbi:hypothetical protein [Pontibacter populi]|uniref:Lipoprotein n=1 Tax=Pontibacter populi TaxID=890055 RepID=A0ABV1RVU9_9BACT
MAALLLGCSEENIEKETPVSSSGVIELVAFGLSENPIEENKGFGVAYYCYLNLETDSVFVQKRLNEDEQYETFAWAGTIKGISQNQKLLNFIEVSQKTKNGNIVTTLPNGKFFYDGYHYYSSYKKGNSDKFHFYTASKLESEFEEGVEYMMALYQHEKLKSINSFVNTDSIVVQLVNRPAFNKGRLSPPPPIRVKVNYTPPLEKR